MRVCQPGPLAFQRSMICGGRRNDRSWRGFSNFGRPRRTSFSPLYRFAPAIQSSVISGKSGSCKVRGELFCFAFMAMPHADDAPCGTAGCPCENDKSRIEPASTDEARLAVVLTVIYASEVRPSKHFVCAQHVQAAFVQSPFALRRVACDSHAINVATKTSCVKYELNCFCWLTPELSRLA